MVAPTMSRIKLAFLLAIAKAGMIGAAVATDEPDPVVDQISLEAFLGQGAWGGVGTESLRGAGIFGTCQHVHTGIAPDGDQHESIWRWSTGDSPELIGGLPVWERRVILHGDDMREDTDDFRVARIEVFFATPFVHQVLAENPETGLEEPVYSPHSQREYRKIRRGVEAWLESAIDDLEAMTSEEPRHDLLRLDSDCWISRQKRLRIRLEGPQRSGDWLWLQVEEWDPDDESGVPGEARSGEEDVRIDIDPEAEGLPWSRRRVVWNDVPFCSQDGQPYCAFGALEKACKIYGHPVHLYEARALAGNSAGAIRETLERSRELRARVRLLETPDSRAQERLFLRARNRWNDLVRERWNAMSEANRAELELRVRERLGERARPSQQDILQEVGYIDVDERRSDPGAIAARRSFALRRMTGEDGATVKAEAFGNPAEDLAQQVSEALQDGKVVVWTMFVALGNAEQDGVRLTGGEGGLHMRLITGIDPSRRVFLVSDAWWREQFREVSWEEAVVLNSGMFSLEMGPPPGRSAPSWVSIAACEAFDPARASTEPRPDGAHFEEDPNDG